MTPAVPPARDTIVSVRPVEGDVRRAIRAALADVGWTDVVPRGAAVSLKINLGWDLFIPGSITSPLVLESLIHELRPHVGSIYVVEANQVLEDIERAADRSGVRAICRDMGVTWVNMSTGPTVAVEAPDNVVLRRIEVPRVLRDTLLITVPVMKTHAKTGITGALKNQWGCLPAMRHEYHLVLDDALADLNSVVRPVLAVMDGTIGLEGNGPKSGFPRIADRILCSRDPVALDTVQAICMGLDPSSIAHLQRAAARGIGVADRSAIRVIGLDPERSVVPFRPARHNAVSVVETLLRRSTFKRLFFNTPLFHVCLAGAKLYYRLWTLVASRRAWRVALDHPLYGPQWRRRS